MIAKEKGGSFTPVPAGTHIARCVACIGLGTQQPSSPKFMASYKFMYTWEVPGEIVRSADGKELPMVVSKEYSLSLSKKSKLRADLESWRSRPFTPQELEGFEVEKVVGIPCMISVVHKESGSGNTYAAISSISGLPKGTLCPPQVHPSVLYNVEQGRNEVFQSLPEWIRKKIEACEEWIHPPIDREEVQSDDGGPTAEDYSSVPF